MNVIDQYVEHLTNEEKEKFMAVINYIRTKYPERIESCDYAPKTKFPMFKKNGCDYYVAIVERKGYISIHFGKYNCVDIVKSANSKIKTGVGCAKIPHKIAFPIDKIKEAIDYCFEC